MKFDFSNISVITTDTVVSHLEEGQCPTDEMLLEAAERVTPALMPAMMMRLLRTELGHQAQRKGRPRRNVPRNVLLAHRLRKLHRPNLPAKYLEWLVARLEGKVPRLSEFQRSLRCHNRIAKLKRNNAIRGIYDDLYPLIREHNSQSIEHPIIGTISVAPGSTPSERALATTANTVRWLLGYSPSPATIRNLVSGKNRTRFRESKRR
ncbi:hypothetical protein H7F51_16905 [Novosphingobium flavum]|uniref:Uncharacterized protein n=1 Tax=Novosphingobium flavum TaxID=1778672 RepID=A0A7X1FVM2_9SPHN|nr:hypothetical protein [Novosphingobium flavum]MBC2667202.1 hypothetical protein [Novosphingobium flavum]